MEAHIEIIREMLENIKSCPSGRCSSCCLSVDIAMKSLDTIREREIRREIIETNGNNNPKNP